MIRPQTLLVSYVTIPIILITITASAIADHHKAYELSNKITSTGSAIALVSLIVSVVSTLIPNNSDD